jgi:anti-sigma factor RsiW
VNPLPPPLDPAGERPEGTVPADRGGKPGGSEGCRDFEWMVGPLVDGELPPAEAEEVERHLRGCSSCSRMAEDFRSFDRLARRLEPPPAVSAEEWARVWERSRSGAPVARIGAGRALGDWLVPLLSLAALLLLVAWITLAVVHRSPVPDPQAVKVLKGAPEEVEPTPQKPRTGRSS